MFLLGYRPQSSASCRCAYKALKGPTSQIDSQWIRGVGSWLRVYRTRCFFVANEITPRSAPSGRWNSSFFLVRVQFYYFHLTPASGNLYSTISRTLNSFWACFCPTDLCAGILYGKCRLIFHVAPVPGDNRLCSLLIKILFMWRLWALYWVSLGSFLN